MKEFVDVTNNITEIYQPMTEFIISRAPKELDADSNGEVLIPKTLNSGDTIAVHWGFVKNEVPWRHTKLWQQDAILPGVLGQWIDASSVMPTNPGWTDSSGDVQVYSTGSKLWYWKTASLVKKTDLWRPHVSVDPRPLSPAKRELELPGFYKSLLVCTESCKPSMNYADEVGVVVVHKNDKEIFMNWNDVKPGDLWRPFDRKDPRPEGTIKRPDVYSY